MLTVILLIAGLIDLKYRKIPDFVILLLLLYAVLFNDMPNIVLLSSFLLTALPFLFFSILTDKLKGGDFKFLSALGMAFGITELMRVLAFTTGYAVIYSVVTKQKSVPLAFFVLLGYVSTGIQQILL